MSISSIAASSASAALQTNQLGGTTTPVVDEANMPSVIRNGTAQQKKDYQQALSFESVLVGQMTKTMMGTTGITGSSSDGSDASSDSDDGSDSSFGNDASQQMLASTLPDTLASAIMNNGGLGLAQQLDTSYPTAASSSLSQAAKTGAATDTTTASATSTDTTSTTTGAATDASTSAGQGGATA